jgi:hypothetical protein
MIIFKHNILNKTDVGSKQMDEFNV